MKLKYKLLSMLALVGVVGSGFAAWHFGESTDAEANVSVSIAGYSRVGQVTITDSPAYELDTLNSGANSNPVLFTAVYNPTNAEDAIAVGDVTLTYKITFNAALKEYVYPAGEDPSGSGIATGTWVSGTEVSHAILWREGKNPQNIAAHEAIENLLDDFNIQIEVFADLGAPAPLQAPDTIEISGAPAGNEMVIGDSLTLSAVGKKAGSSNGVDQGVSWSSSDEGVASINGSGLLTAIGAGTTTITATSTYVAGLMRRSGGAVAASFVLTVSEQGEPEPDVVPTQITSSPGTLSVQEEADATLPVPVIKNVGGDELTLPYTWAVVAGGNGSVTISENGLAITGGTPGTVNMKVYPNGYESVSAQLVVTVTAKPEPAYHNEIVLAWTNSVAGGIEIDDLAPITIVHKDDQGEPWTGAVGELIWDIYVKNGEDYESIPTTNPPASVNGENQFSASIAGDYRVFLMTENADGSDYITSNGIDVTVNPEAPYLDAFEIDGGNITGLVVGNTRNLTATAIDQNGDTWDGAVTWASSNSTAVSVNTTTGALKAEAYTATPVTITATCGAKTDTITVSYAAPTLASIVIAAPDYDSEAGIEIDAELALTIAYKDQHGNDIAPSGTLEWLVDDDTTGSVVLDGTTYKFSATAAGEYDIYAAIGAIDSNILSVTVNEGEEPPVGDGPYMVLDFTSTSAVTASGTAFETDTGLTALRAVAKNPSDNSSMSASVKSVAQTNNVYPGNATADQGNYPKTNNLIRFSTSKVDGRIDIVVDKPINKAVITADGWGHATDPLKHDEASIAFNGSASQSITYTGTYRELTFEFDESTTISITAIKRVFVSKIELYEAVQEPFVPTTLNVLGDSEIITNSENTYTATVSDGVKTVEDTSVIWSVTNGSGTGIVTGGKIKGTSAGTITVSATSGEYGISGSKTVTVSDPAPASPDTVVIQNTTKVGEDDVIAMEKGGSAHSLAAIVYDQYGEPMELETVTWAVTSGSYISIASGTNQLVADDEGTGAVVTATVASKPSVTSTVIVNVTDPSSQPQREMELYSTYTVSKVGSTNNYNTIVTNHKSTGSDSANIPWTICGINETTSPIRIGGKTGNTNQSNSLDFVSESASAYLIANNLGKSINKVVLNYGAVDGIGKVYIEVASGAFSGLTENAKHVSYHSATISANGSLTFAEPTEGAWDNVTSVRIMIGLTSGSNKYVALTNVQLYTLV